MRDGLFLFFRSVRSSCSSSLQRVNTNIRNCGKKVGASNKVLLDNRPFHSHKTQEMLRKASDRWRAIGVRGELAEKGRFIHHVIVRRSYGWVVGVYFVKDDGP